MTIPDWPGTFTRGYIVRRSHREESKRWPEAWFQYAADAEKWMNERSSPSRFEIIDQESGRLVIGTTGHGHAIMETLRRKGEL